MDLHQQIKQYYFDRLDLLTPDKRFHFASRIAAWEGDNQAYPVLSDLKGYMTAEGDLKASFNYIVRQPIVNVYGKKLRREYFDKYPKLFGVHNLLFRVRHLKEVYKIDAREILLKIFPMDQLEELYWALRSDPQAMRILSRFAIDYIYLLEILFDRPECMNPELIYALKDGYDLSDKTQLHLFVYLFTHSIIADTNFYIRKIPIERLATYKIMLAELESIIQKNKDVLKLDGKFEFLVTARICGFESLLFEVFQKQALDSLSPEGTFIIDELVGSPQSGLNGLERSEHRNVLFIMSQSEFKPHSTLLE